MRPPLHRNALVVLLFLTGLLAHAGNVFVHPTFFPAGNNPAVQSLADLNGDGNVDVLVRNGPLGGPSSFGVVPGNGNGRFGGLIQTPLTFLTGHPVVSDINADGILDLVAIDIGSNPGVVHILLGKGDGSFDDAAQYPVGEDPQTPVIADMNSDGDPDIVLVQLQPHTFQSEIVVLLNKGDGTFRRGMENLYSPIGASLVAADFNRDGKTDVATSFCCSGLNIFLGNGDGTFQSPLTIELPSSFFLAAADFDADGIVDLATQQNSDLAVLHGNGDGTFRSPRLFPMGEGSGDGLHVLDFNADGVPDIFTNAAGLNNEILLNRGGGRGFYNPVSYRTGILLGTSIVAGDINGDGFADLVADAPQNGSIGVLVNRRGRFPSGAAAYSAQVTQVPDGMLVADFNRDGSPDVVVGSYYDDTILLSQPGGRYSRASTLDMSGGGFSMIAADFNGDQKLDIVSATRSAVELLLGNGDGTFAPKRTINNTEFANQVLAADLNGDENTDVAISTGTEVLVLIGNGNGTFQPAVHYLGSPNAVWIAPADFNADGKLDFVVADLNSLSLMLGNGDGTFQPPVSVDTGVLIEISAIVSADLNNDGKIDLALIGFDEPTILATYLGNGDGTFQPKMTTKLHADGSAALAVGDFNKDGNLDVVVGSNGYKTEFKSLRLLLGNGDGTFQSEQLLPYSRDLRYWSIAVSDFNKDGWPDLIFADTWGQAVFLPNAAGR